MSFARRRYGLAHLVKGTHEYFPMQSRHTPFSRSDRLPAKGVAHLQSKLLPNGLPIVHPLLGLLGAPSLTVPRRSLHTPLPVLYLHAEHFISQPFPNTLAKPAPALSCFRPQGMSSKTQGIKGCHIPQSRLQTSHIRVPVFSSHEPPQVRTMFTVLRYVDRLTA